MKTVRRILSSAIAFAFFVLAPCSHAQKAILTLPDSAWGNTGLQTTKPASFIMSFGACVVGSGNCGGFGAGTINLGPYMFYPSNCPQKVVISSGAEFDAITAVFAQSGNLNVWLPRVLSNDGSIPSDFFTKNQGNGGNVHVGYAATIKLITIQIPPFSFQPVQISGGEYWEALGKDGNPPSMVITVY